jgi:L-aspartate oxidase
MQQYDERGSLAPRDIVARAIDSEMKKRGEEYVCLDCRHLDRKEFENHFPNILQRCASIGIDVTKEMIPVVPAAHYICVSARKCAAMSASSS